jgi:hypothetical protein
VGTSDAYLLTILLLGIGLSIKAAETLSLLPEYGKRGSFDYEITGDDALLAGRFAPVWSKLYSQAGVRAVAWLSLASFLATAIVYELGGSVRVVLVGFILLNVLAHYRQAFGLDGADQMALLLLMVLLFCFIASSDNRVRLLGLWFIALQLALSYIVSGVAKVLSTEWRSGVAIQGILSTYTYGTGTTRRLVIRSRRLCQILCWSVMLTEIAIPFGLLLGRRGALAALTLGALLHVSIALIMGLNDFVWSFVAAYPGLRDEAGSVTVRPPGR